jgi:hypothetical protein
MPATDVLESELLNLIFLNDNFDQIGDATGIQGSTTPGNLEISLHTGTLDDTSTQTTSEAAYGSYARVDVGRSGSNWTEASGTVDNDNAITFPSASSGSETETDFGIGSDVVANELWLYGALSSSLAVSSGITPEFAAGDLDISVT